MSLKNLRVSQLVFLAFGEVLVLLEIVAMFVMANNWDVTEYLLTILYFILTGCMILDISMGRARSYHYLWFVIVTVVQFLAVRATLHLVAVFLPSTPIVPMTTVFIVWLVLISALALWSRTLTIKLEKEAFPN